MVDFEININDLKKMLNRVVWDYNISEDDLVEIFLYDKKGHSMNKNDLQARLLGYYSWHFLIKHLGYNNAFSLLNDEAIGRIFPKSYQIRLYGLREILSGRTLPTSG